MRFITGVGRKTKSVTELWVKGWNEKPEIMSSFGLGVIGMLMGIYGVNQYINEDGQYRRYRMTYVVYRPDDPDVAHIKTDDGPYTFPKNRK